MYKHFKLDTSNYLWNSKTQSMQLCDALQYLCIKEDNDLLQYEIRGEKRSIYYYNKRSTDAQATILLKITASLQFTYIVFKRVRLCIRFNQTAVRIVYLVLKIWGFSLQ